MRSDKIFDASVFESLLRGEPLAQRLENIMALRDSGIVPAAQIADSLYQDLLSDPIATVENIYRKFDMPLSAAVRQRMLAYLAAKPQGKFGRHAYAGSAALREEQKWFRRYRERYGVVVED
jgi:hypothetical protein